MGLFSFGKRPNHRRFDYIPRYYDPAKEELEERLNKYKSGDQKLKAGGTELMKSRIRGGFRRNYRTGGQDYKAATKKSNMRLLMIMGLLLLLTAYFISNYLPKIVAVFE